VKFAVVIPASIAVMTHWFIAAQKIPSAAKAVAAEQIPSAATAPAVIRTCVSIVITASVSIAAAKII